MLHNCIILIPFVLFVFAAFSFDSSTYNVSEGASLTFQVCKTTGNTPGGNTIGEFV